MPTSWVFMLMQTWSHTSAGETSTGYVECTKKGTFNYRCAFLIAPNLNVIITSTTSLLGFLFLKLLETGKSWSSFKRKLQALICRPKDLQAAPEEASQETMTNQLTLQKTQYLRVSDSLNSWFFEHLRWVRFKQGINFPRSGSWAYSCVVPAMWSGLPVPMPNWQLLFNLAN